jgi:hypothetical protein
VNTEQKNNEAQQQAQKDLDRLAVKIQKLLAENPNLGVGHLAAKTKTEPELISAILDSYSVETGTPQHVGPGQGGGWVPQPKLEGTNGEE